MADILIHSAVPSLFTHTESASNLMINTSTENSHTNNKYTGHVSRLRNVFTEQSTIINNKQEQIRHIPIEFINTSSSTNRFMSNSTENNSYTVLNKRNSNSEQQQHYDFPADAIEQLKKQQRDENDLQSTTRIIPSLLPSNILKRMDHLNTIFIRPTKIERILPEFVFQDNHEQLKSNENLIVYESDRPSSPLFYEKPGIPKLDDDDDDDDKLNGTRQVKFSNAPIRVYSTYSSSEYDRRNNDIDPFAASAEYELEKRIEKMDVFNVEVEKGPEGLGISVLGMGVGADSGLEKLGIFVKTLNSEGVIAKDGRIQIGDQIIEVNDQSLVGVTHSFATNVLKTASGLIKFVIGREKDLEKSEILNLIQRSLQLDKQREDMSRTYEKYHDAYYEQNFNDDDDDDEKIPNDFELEILKKCYESLEKTLENTTKEKEQYQQFYHDVQNDLKQIEEKYLQSQLLIKELQHRESELRELYQQQTDLNQQKEKRINELMKKIEELEKVIASSVLKHEDNPSIDPIQYIVSHSSTTPEHVLNRSAGQQLISPSRTTTTTTSTTQSPSNSLDKLSTYSQQDQTSCLIHTTDQFDLENEQNSKNLQSKHLSTPSLGEISNDFDILNTKSHVSKVPSLEQTNNDEVSTNKDIKIKDWSSDQCIQWLTAQEMTSLIPLFLNRNIDGEKLLLLDSSKMKAMGLKSSKDRDQLKIKIKELKHAELNRLREQFLGRPSLFHRSIPSGNRLRSSSLTKLKERKFFSSNNGK